MTTFDDDATPPQDASRNDPDDEGRAPAQKPPSDGDSTEPASESPASESTEGDSDVEAPADEESAAGEPTEIPDDEGLPEWEPLTPELVEDEAIRGDFVLRWAVVLLAFLMGCVQIHDTRTLVHIKTGQYIASNGWLPPSVDVFSSTASDHQWINLSWLFDLAVAGIFSLSGAIGISIFTALLAAITFWLVGRISQPNVSSWWGSVMGALALLACYPQFIALPDVITLLGLALVLWILFCWRLDPSSRQIWWLVPIVLIWSNLDPKLYLGLCLLILYAVGSTIGRMAGGSNALSSGAHRQLCFAVGASVVAALGNPFGWHAWLSPTVLYGTDYPVLRDYAASSAASAMSTAEHMNYSILDSGFWSSLRVHSLAGIFTLVTAGVAFILNRAKCDWGMLLVYVGFCLFAASVGQNLPAAALVACALGTLNAQQWYQSNFRQTYSIETRELVFSRGGRAVTVLAIFALAFLGSSDRLSGPDGAQIGVGFHPRLVLAIEGFRSDLEGSFDDRPFNFVPAQGDLLIWVDQRPFVDSRVSLYAGEGDNDILLLHDQARHALRIAEEQDEEAPQTGILESLQLDPEADGSPTSWVGDSELWKEIFNRFRITHVIPRLFPITNPNKDLDYQTYRDLLYSPDSWQLAKLGVTTAIFYRTDTDDAELSEFLDRNRFSFVDAAFRTNVEGDENSVARIDWPQPQSVYKKILTPYDEPVPNSVRRSDHYISSLGILAGDHATSLSLIYLVVRAANEGLVRDPNNAHAFRQLGAAYRALHDFEKTLCPDASILRYYQTVHAYNQALIIEPDNQLAHMALMDMYIQFDKKDLALRELHATEELLAANDPGGEQAESFDQQYGALRDLYESELSEVREQLDKNPDKEKNWFATAQRLSQLGFSALALETLESVDPSELVQNLQAQRMQAILLMEVGRADEALQVIRQIELIITGYSESEEDFDESRLGSIEWRAVAALVHLANAGYAESLDLWNEEIKLRDRKRLTGLVQTLPLAQPPAPLIGNERIIWPIQHTAAVEDLVYRHAGESGALLWNIAIGHLEVGNLQQAERYFRKVLEADPNTQFATLVQFYLYLLTDEIIDVEPDHEKIPVSPDMFAPEEPANSENS